MSEEKKIIFPCRKCRENISTTRTEVDESIRSKGRFECPYCNAKNTKSADIYTRMMAET